VLRAGLLLGYYARREDARSALQALRRKGYLRLALLHRPAEGKVRLIDPPRRTRVAFILLCGLLLGGTTAALNFRPSSLPTDERSAWLAPLIPILSSGFGTLVGWLLARRLEPSVDRKLLQKHSRWLVAEETLVVLQGPLARLRWAVPILRGAGETQPALFVLHPERELPEGQLDFARLPLPATQMQQHAATLASEHETGPAGPGDPALLDRLDAARSSIHTIVEGLQDAVHLEQTVGGASEWLLDNEYLVESHALDIQTNLPDRFYRLLPTLANGPDRGRPRVYGLASELAAHAQMRLERQSILEFLESYQDVQPLTIAELWALPMMLRVVLIERIHVMALQAMAELRQRQLADFWGNRLLATARRDPNQLFAVLAELAENVPDPAPYFAAQIIGHLYDEVSALVPAQSWLERTLRRPLSEVNLREQSRQGSAQVSIGNAITSLRQLALLDWREVFEAQSRVERILRLEPAWAPGSMDFETRDSYRRAVEQLSRASGVDELQIARIAVRLASRPPPMGAEPEVGRHVGHYLVGAGRPELRAALNCREPYGFRMRQWIYRYHTPLYLSAVALVAASSLALWVRLAGRSLAGWLGVCLGILLLGPSTQIAQEIVNYLVTRLLPPRTLPKMDFQKTGIPDAFRTLVVAPILMTDQRTVQEEAERLEIRYLANPESNLLFGLFTDFSDADQPTLPGDAALLQTAVECIQALNQRHATDRFFLFHRGRTWTDSEARYIGWERKRGKLEELNQLIAGARAPEAPQLVYVGQADRLADVRFVITVDSDTGLPRDSARRMIETLAHPLNQPRFDPRGRIAAGSYAIIQPRVSPTLPSATSTAFSRLFTDPVGIDPYTRAVSEVYQDLSGEGSYHGKGIYDPRAFSRMLSGRFPEQRLLSHDLIEGAHLRVGLASDIELFDEFPSDYATYALRQHRWIRGDWQIADWILPRVPLPDGTRGPNPLSVLNRWKIFDNLRRSLIPAASLGLLLASWLAGPQAALASSALVAATVLFRPLAQPFTWATTPHSLWGLSLRQVRHDLLRGLVEAALLAHQAWLSVEAIVTVWWRRWVSKRKLLEWNPAQMAQWDAAGNLAAFVRKLSLVTGLSLGLGGLVYLARPESLPFAAPWLGLWALTPLIGWELSSRPRPAPKADQLSGSERRLLRLVARRTWRFFDEFVGEETSWLPPDNYQVSHRDQLALRTSPTNIGMWALSALAACDFGYLNGDQVIERLSRTMQTLGSLPRYEGHLLNWYDLRTLQPLEPRYVSSVDSGNLLAALWGLEQGLTELAHAPLLDGRSLAGLRDALGILAESLRKEDLEELQPAWARELLSHREGVPDRALDSIRWLRELSGRTAALSERVLERAGPDAPSTEWARQAERQTAAWLRTVDRYLRWVEILGEKTEAELASLGPEVTLATQAELHQVPSLAALAGGRAGSITRLRRAMEDSHPADPLLQGWLERLMQAFQDSQWLAGEMLAAVQGLIGDVRRFADDINMAFLYEPQRRLFAVGFNVSEGRLDSAYYDLLASEARLGSFVAIARGDVPVEHWLSMSRPYTSIGRRRALLSWTGTMFEYLMPLLLQRTYSNSLLEKACQEAVAVQIDYGRRRGVPWGVSESAFGDLDLNKTYQYRAFGVPELGLKRGLEEDLVVAPYATLLAVSLAPRPAVENLKQLTRSGLLGDYGYFEAIDYSAPPLREGERGVIVRAYMAHHQGMALLALDNFINDGPMQRRFHADPRVRSAEPLLFERIPIAPPIHQISTRERASFRIGAAEAAPSESRFDTPNTPTPKTQLLSNGTYSLMVTNAGGGYSQWREFQITRWRSDTTRDAWGTFCYIRDTDSDRLWSSAYHPVRAQVKDYSASFTLERAVLRRKDGNMETTSEIIVSPEDDVEIRRISLVNHSPRVRNLELTSYVELALAPHRTDRQHPAFSKLFIQTEALGELEALLASRRPRSPDEPAIFAGHRLTLDQDSEQRFEFETDRRHFIGRGGSMERPLRIGDRLTNSQGYVLDPIFSLRRSVRLRPLERMQLSLVLAAGESRERVLALLEKYSHPAAIDQAMELAWAAAQLELRLLRIQPDEARRFQQLASHLLYPNPSLRPPADRLRGNQRGQVGLWPYGVSGDLPIALVTIGEARDISLVRQLLQAHAYWRQHGLMADLVILNEESSSYDQPLREQLEGLIQARAMFTAVDQPGGVFLLSTDQMPGQDLALFLAAAHVSLIAARGPLSQQLATHPETPVYPDRIRTKTIAEEPSAPLPFMELPYFNSLGGFTSDGREYAIYLGPGTHAPAPWVNVFANPSFGALVSESGSGPTWYGNSQRNRLTDWSNDPVLDPPSEAIYIRDQETGAFWTPTARPIRERGAYRARHGAGYTVFEHNSHAIEQTLTVFVPMDEAGGAPVKLQLLRLRNDSRRRRRLSVTYYLAWTLGEGHEASQLHTVTEWDEEFGALLATNGYHPDYPDRVAFAAMSPTAQSFSGDRTEFLGRLGGLRNPAAMQRAGLSGRMGAGLDPCAALQVRVELDPGEEAQLTCMLGQASSLKQAQQLVHRYRETLNVEAALGQTQSWWNRRLGTIQVQTPEPSANLLLNRWLLYQTLSCRIWGRSGFYQSGGAFGFRDQLQDVLALLQAAPELAREHILLAARHQFAEGDVLHWWHPPADAGTRTRVSDDLLWLPYAVAQYVRVTGDAGILQENIPFVRAPLLEDDQLELFLEPAVTTEQASLFEHCRRAVERGLTTGPHGLALIGTGDWNDAMNRVGVEGKGESVWLAWFLVEVLSGMAELAGRMGETELMREYRARGSELTARVERQAWDGEWYWRATFDDGTPIGSAASQEAKIDSLPQSWAWLCGAGDRERARTALESAWKHLVLENQKLVLLFKPPFERATPSPGYIQGYPPGVRENGGQYTHAALWLAMAFARSGDGDRAVRLLRMLNPIEHARNAEEVWRYGVEPYAVAADVYRLAGREGQGGWTWYTGSAAWMYRAWIEEVLGVKMRGDRLTIDPVIPPSWDRFSLQLRHGQALYEIEVENPDGLAQGVRKVELDGRELAELAIPLELELVKHRVRVLMGLRDKTENGDSPGPADGPPPEG